MDHPRRLSIARSFVQGSRKPQARLRRWTHSSGSIAISPVYEPQREDKKNEGREEYETTGAKQPQ